MDMKTQNLTVNISKLLNHSNLHFNSIILQQYHAVYLKKIRGVAGSAATI